MGSSQLPHIGQVVGPVEEDLVAAPSGPCPGDRIGNRYRQDRQLLWRDRAHRVPVGIGKLPVARLLPRNEDILYGYVVEPGVEKPDPDHRLVGTHLLPVVYEGEELPLPYRPLVVLFHDVRRLFLRPGVERADHEPEGRYHDGQQYESAEHFACAPAVWHRWSPACVRAGFKAAKRETPPAGPLSCPGRTS